MVLVRETYLFNLNLLQPIKIPYMNDNDNMDVGDSDPQPTCSAPRKTLPGNFSHIYTGIPRYVFSLQGNLVISTKLKM